MVMLVSLQQASDRLRRDTTDDDADLTLIIKQVSSAILAYLGTVDFLDSSGEVEVDTALDPVGVPESIQWAAMVMIGYAYKDRDAEDYTANSEDRLGKMSLPKAVHWMLDPHRDPRLA